jgi:signal transduction histidine kinase
LRRLAFYVLLVAAPTVALGAGWLRAAQREERGRERARRAAVERAADAVVSAATEELEALRRREDARPYDVYSYYYAPPDVLATQEAVVVSPLAAPPEDERILGYFQIDPGREMRSPAVHPDAPPAFRAAGERLLALLRPAVLDACAPLAHGSVEEIQRSHESARRVLRNLPSNPVQSTGEWATTLANEIRQAQAGSLIEQNALNLRGRAPRPSRANQSWAEANQAVSSNAGPVRTAPQTARPRPPRPRAPPPPSVPPDRAIVYTPMAYGRLGGRLALYRVVSSQGSSSVQGVLLDETALRSRWLPALARRHAGAVARPHFVALPKTAGCSAARRMPPPLEDRSLCLTPLSAASGGHAMQYQLLTLVGLVLLVVAGSAALLLAERRAARLAVMQREFVASVSHELRTPLTTLRMHAELLREGWVEEAVRSRFYDDLVVESTRLGQLVENVLTLSRLERGRAPVLRAGDLGAAISEAAEKRRRFVELKGFDLAVDAPEVEARFDREAIDTIVANLLDNAVKYGGGTDARIAVAVRASADRALIAVSDGGPGIPPTERERVFEQFYRAGAGGTGTGLGLTLVRRLAREQSGDARVIATATGCTVEVWLPRRTTAA